MGGSVTVVGGSVSVIGNVVIVGVVSVVVADVTVAVTTAPARPEIVAVGEMRGHRVVVDDDRVLGGPTRLMADRDRRMALQHAQQRLAVQRARQPISGAEAKNHQHAQPDGEGEATDHRGS